METFICWLSLELHILWLYLNLFNNKKAVAKWNHLLYQLWTKFLLQDSEGETPVHICAREGLLGLAQTLCAFGCNVDTPNEDGMLPLHLGNIYRLKYSIFVLIRVEYCSFDGLNLDKKYSLSSL